jgi:hypothetical protein
MAAAAIAGVACGDSGTYVNHGSNQGLGGFGSSGSGGGLNFGASNNLVSTCDQICNNVVAQCAPAADFYGNCLSVCGDLNLVNLGCLNPFASYLACIAGAKSVTCEGNSVLISPPECATDRAAALSCNAGPGLVSACIAVPSNGACGSPGTSSESAGTALQQVFCVGAPETCTAPQPNPLGIGIYCCPQ